MIDIHDTELTTLILCAFRYALERNTGIDYEISNLIIKYKKYLPLFAIEQIRRDIERQEEIDKNFNKKYWLQLKNEL